MSNSSNYVMWTDHEDAIVETGVKKGHTRQRIVEELELAGSTRTISAVNNRILKQKTGAKKATTGVKWSDDENETLFELMAEQVPMGEIADRLNSQYSSGRTPKKIRARLTWLRRQARSRIPEAGKPEVKKAPLATTSAVQHQLAFPENTERQLRVRYPGGSITIALQGTIPDAVKNVLNDLVWENGK